MQNIILTPITVPELVNLIASEVEARLKKVEHHEPLQDRIDLEQAAEVLGLSRSAIYKLTSKKEIPHKKYGKSKLEFSRMELEVWKQQRTVRIQSPEEIATQHLAKVARKRLPK